MPDPPIDLSKPRYDQSTFWGRYSHFKNVTDPRTLLTTSEQISEAKRIIALYKAKGIIPDDDTEKLWQAQKVIDTTLHPDTQEVIPMPFRVSAFVPANILICMGMLMPGAGIANQVFWQWINQTYNICLNHANRNASNPITNQDLAINYAAAVSASCGVALGLGRAVEKLAFRPGVKTTLAMLVPFFSVAIAGIVNVFMMRRNEVSHGINVKTEEGVVVGKSKKAGMSALAMVATSRVVTAIPVLTVVPFTVNALLKTRFFKSRPSLVIPLNIGLIYLALETALPAAIALFPQNIRVAAKSLEPQFHDLVDSNNQKLTHLYFNRGL